MGRRGPAPEPTWLQLAKGEPSKRSLNRAEPEPKKIPWAEPPAYFDDDHRRLWFGLCRVLHEMDLLTSADVFPLERYVVFLAKWRACQTFLEVVCKGNTSYAVRGEGTPAVRNASGEIVREAVPGPVKHFKPYPEVRLLLDFSSHLLHIEDRFGLSPSSRSRIVAEGEGNGPPGGGDDDDFTDLDS